MKHYLSSRDVTTMRGIKRHVEGDTTKPRGAARRYFFDNCWARLVLTPSGGIPAIDDVTPGNADCDLAKLDDDEDIEDITDADAISVYNHGPKIPGDTYILAVRDPWSRWWAVPNSYRTTAKFLTPGGGIAARSAPDTPGSATCEMLQFDGTDHVSFSPTVDAVVYNDSGIAVDGDTYITAIIVDGYWFAIFEPCPEPA